MENRLWVGKIKKTVKRSKGFSLVEVLISILILSIALFSIAALIANVVVLQVSLKEKENAHFIAMGQVRELESLDIDDLVASSDEEWIGDKKYRVNWTVEENTVVNGESVGKRMIVRVSWDGVRGIKTLELVRDFSASASDTRGKRLQ